MMIHKTYYVSVGCGPVFQKIKENPDFQPVRHWLGRRYRGTLFVQPKADLLGIGGHFPVGSGEDDAWYMSRE